MADNLTRQETQFKNLMGLLAVLFLMTALLFAFIPEQMTMLSNFVSGMIKMDEAPIVRDITLNTTGTMRVMDRGYVTLSVAGMAMLFFIAVMCFINPVKYQIYIPILLVGKFISTAVGLCFYFWVAKYLTHLIMPLTDFPIFVIVLIFWLRAKYSNPEDDEDEE